MENPTEMELVNASFTILERSSTPSLTNCERRQLVRRDLKIISIMLDATSHTPLNALRPVHSLVMTIRDLAALRSRRATPLDERQQQALAGGG
ncbi:hypothetical protein TNCV_3660181 [Trichonephila clavipes]|nr:hypothetical protein TNCV_3660181 [Trichonephila clavipes]